MRLPRTKKLRLFRQAENDSWERRCGGRKTSAPLVLLKSLQEGSVLRGCGQCGIEVCKLVIHSPSWCCGEQVSWWMGKEKLIMDGCFMPAADTRCKEGVIAVIFIIDGSGVKCSRLVLLPRSGLRLKWQVLLLSNDLGRLACLPATTAQQSGDWWLDSVIWRMQ